MREVRELREVRGRVQEAKSRAEGDERARILRMPRMSGGRVYTGGGKGARARLRGCWVLVGGLMPAP